MAWFWPAAAVPALAKAGLGIHGVTKVPIEPGRIRPPLDPAQPQRRRHLASTKGPVAGSSSGHERV
ncbi:hypothetical protein ONA91_34835, partial [Micromonospora sp. DR5-3]|uniref:hypothetical protein n=1 Tax=Micromonospora sp. DR5-3 TaxID=2992129 RepID=UPI002231DA0B